MSVGKSIIGNELPTEFGNAGTQVLLNPSTIGNELPTEFGNAGTQVMVTLRIICS